MISSERYPHFQLCPIYLVYSFSSAVWMQVDSGTAQGKPLWASPPCFGRKDCLLCCLWVQVRGLIMLYLLAEV